MSINRIIISGRLTADPELKSTPSGINVVTISVAVDRNYKNDTGEYDVDFFDVVCWRGTADFVAKHFRKGDKIEIDGRLQTRKWRDKYDQNRVTVEIIADNVDFGGKKQSADTSYDATSVQTNEFRVLPDDDDALF